MNRYRPIIFYARDLLQAGIDNENWPIRFAAAEALADVEDERGAPVLKEGIDSADAFIRDRAVVGLGKFRSRSYSELFVELLSDKDPMVRGHALESLALACREAALDKIVSSLLDKHEFVQECAVLALSRLEKNCGGPILEAVALARGYDSTYMIRLSAAFYLAQNGNAVGRQVLYEALECGDSWVAFLAAKNLAELGDVNGLPQLRDMLQWGGWPEKISALEGLLKIGRKQDLSDALYRPVDIPDPMTRLEAVRLLDHFDPGQTYHILGQCLAEGEETIKIRALEIIGEIGRLELAGLLENILIHAPEHIKATALMAIEKIGDVSLLPYLVPILERSHWLLRLQTARVIVKLAANLSI